MAITDEEIQRLRNHPTSREDMDRVLDELDRLRKENAELREKGIGEASHSYSLEGEIEALEHKLVKAREALRKLDDAVSCNCHLYGPQHPRHADECNTSIIDRTLKELSE